MSSPTDKQKNGHHAGNNSASRVTFQDKTWATPIKPHPRARVMLRHTRALLEIYRANGVLGANLARRAILAVPRMVLAGLEKTAYDALEDYCRELTRQIERNSRQKSWKTSLGFYLSFLRLRLASSMFDIRETLKRRRERIAATRQHLQPEAEAVSEMGGYDAVYGDYEDRDETVVKSHLKNRTAEDLAWEEVRLTQIIELLGDLTDMPLKMRELLAVLENAAARVAAESVRPLFLHAFMIR